MDYSEIKCWLCNSSTNDVLQYGQFCEIGSIQVHLFCLLLSSNLKQMGPENEGILGFLEKDIRNEVEKGQRSECSYCRNNGATIFCSEENCRIKFHLPCGIRNNSTHRFYGDFKSYCYDHRIIEVMVPILHDELNVSTNCDMCNETVVPWPNINTLWAHCCMKTSWFHRNCIQSLALTAESFKCPVCNNEDFFVSSMAHQGIYIPSIRWETIQCKLCQCEEITCNDRIKSARITVGCSACISSESSDEPMANDGFSKIRKFLEVNSENIDQPGCSTVLCSTYTQTDFPELYTTVITNIKSGKITTLKKNEPNSDLCGPFTRSKLRESRDSEQLRQKILKQAKQNKTKISTKIDGAPSVNASPYITRSRINEKRKCVYESNNLQTKKTEN